MATVSTSLRMFDQMTQPLEQINNAANRTTTALDQLSNAGNREMKLPNTLNTVNDSAQKATSSAQELARAQDNVANSQQHLNNSLSNVASSMQQITNVTNRTIGEIKQFNNASNRPIKLQNTLNTVSNSAQKSTSNIEKLTSAQDNATNSQERLNNSFNKGASASSGLTGKIKGLVGAYVGIQAAKEGIKATIGGAMGLQQQLFTFQGIMGNKEVANAYFDNLQKKANESVFGFKEFASNARKYMQFTKNTDDLDKLANLSERLTLMSPEQGLEGAGFALKEMMSGDGTSLKERFGFGKADIEILKASKSMDEFTSKFDTLLNKSGYTNSMLAQYNKSASAQFDNLASNIETGLAQAGNNALELLAPVFTQLNEAFAKGDFQPFFDGLSNGIAGAVNLVLGLANGIGWIGQVVQANWAIIEPILVFVAGALLGLLIQKLWISAVALWAQVPALWAQATAWFALNWPIMLIVGAVALFIYILMQCGVTAEQITGFIGALFAVLGAGIYNQVACLYNVFAALAEFLINLFVDPVYAIKKLFYDMTTGVLGWISDLAKGLTDLVNMIPGVEVNLHSGIDGLISKIQVPQSDKKVLKIPRMKQINYEKAASAGYSKGAGITKGIGSMLDKFKGMNNTAASKVPKTPKTPNMAAWNKAQGPGNLSMPGDKNKLGKHAKDANKHLKNIDDKIDVSNEHLEMMRDIAEQESIQNFVTLTPTVQVKTGDIKQEADINTIISKIESYMENELVTSAEGVYA